MRKHLISILVLFFMVLSVSAESSEKALAKEILHDLKDIHKRGINMEGIRMRANAEPFDFSAARTCGIHMDRNQQFAIKANKRAEKLSLNYFYTKVAANLLYTKYCVSCLPEAIEDCDDLEEYIELGQEQFDKKR